jgi:hypothetical protein
MTDTAFEPSSLSGLTRDYPEKVHKLRHNLSGHPLLTLPAMVELATRLRPEHVEHNQGDLPIGIAPGDVPAPRLSVAETIRSIEQNGSWMALKFIENAPEYRELMEFALREVEPAIRDKTGPMLNLESFIFVSAPGAVTPFHFDPEHNILVQIRGHKVLMTSGLPARKCMKSSLLARIIAISIGTRNSHRLASRSRLPRAKRSTFR